MILLHFLRLVRMQQWLKNLMLFFPPFLGGALRDVACVGRGMVPFLSFCFVSSSCYVLNDILDARNDARHPAKMCRPLASGAISIPVAVASGIVLAGGGVILALPYSAAFLLLLVSYGVCSILYSVKLKEYPVIDIFCVAAGFLLRLQAGGEVFSIAISEWLFLSVFLLALFLSTGKRLCEKNTLGADAGDHRRSLRLYPEGYLDGIMYMTGGAVLVTYTMYVISRHALIYTVPLCAFGLMRFMLLVKSGAFGDPTESLLRDRVLFVVGFCWAVMVGWGIYGR